MTHQNIIMDMIVRVMMNSEKFLQLADVLENLPEYRFHINRWSSVFDNARFYEDSKEVDESISETLLYSNNECYYWGNDDILDINVCNTAGCIAGWAIALDNNGVAKFPVIREVHDANTITFRGAMSLGLTMRQAKSLFFTSSEKSIWNSHLDDYYIFLDEWSRDNILNMDLIGTGDRVAISEMFDNNEIIINNKAAAYVLRSIGRGFLEL